MMFLIIALTPDFSFRLFNASSPPKLLAPPRLDLASHPKSVWEIPPMPGCGSCLPLFLLTFFNWHTSCILFGRQFMTGCPNKKGKWERIMEKGAIQRRIVALAAAFLMSSIAVGSAVMPAGDLNAMPIGQAVYA
ncbi:hypothetical protein WJT74_00895 [Sphingomicrobium sp. XHP0239]|uniref:hypothetical protein n=1 Tax=Sphingomicrobium maritimum TaxID=3133972 RepID=UPI0031CCA486